MLITVHTSALISSVDLALYSVICSTTANLYTKSVIVSVPNTYSKYKFSENLIKIKEKIII